MPRTISLYEKAGNRLINRIEIEYDNILFFREVYNYPKGDELMYDSYKIDDIVNKKIYDSFGIMVDLQRYDCYVEFFE